MNTMRIELGDIPTRYLELEAEAAYENAGRELTCEVCGSTELLAGHVTCAVCHADIDDGSDVVGYMTPVVGEGVR